MQPRAYNTPKTPMPKRLYADKVQCHYWWEMFLNPDQRAIKLVGYSKFEGYRENQSKEQSLMRSITMLYSKGYFFKTTQIIIYERVGPIANVELDKIILSIKPSAIAYYGDSKDVERFLSNFRMAVDNGIAPKVHLRPVTQ